MRTEIKIDGNQSFTVSKSEITQAGILAVVNNEPVPADVEKAVQRDLEMSGAFLRGAKVGHKIKKIDNSRSEKFNTQT